jgi:hypothetical protein
MSLTEKRPKEQKEFASPTERALEVFETLYDEGVFTYQATPDGYVIDLTPKGEELLARIRAAREAERSIHTALECSLKPLFRKYRPVRRRKR